jgi:folate-dependent phosphoribosylglycinamide formyltransferase PurN
MSASGGVVMVAGDGESTRLVFNRLNQAIGVEKVIIEGPVDKRQFLRRRVEKLGLRTVAGQILFKAMVDKPLQLGSAARVREIKREFDLDDRPIPERVAIRVPSINTPEAIKHLEALSPAVVVVNGTRIIAKKVLETIRVPFINTHAGITPLYRGVHGGYWALAKGDPSHCGVTVHLIDPGIDTGAIIGQALISPTAGDNFATYPFLQIAAGLPVLVNAVKAALAGTLQLERPPEGPSRLWSHPTLAQYLKTRIQNGTR